MMCTTEARNVQNPPEVESILLLIKNLFELREYKKCAHILKEYRLKYPDNQSVIFYYYYSLWMNGLIRKEEEIYENGNRLIMQKILTKYLLILKSTPWSVNYANSTPKISSMA